MNIKILNNMILVDIFNDLKLFILSLSSSGS